MPNPDSHLGVHEDFAITKHPEGYYWADTRPGCCKRQGPFKTSERAYEHFHDYTGWVRTDL